MQADWMLLVRLLLVGLLVVIHFVCRSVIMCGFRQIIFDLLLSRCCNHDESSNLRQPWQVFSFIVKPGYSRLICVAFSLDSFQYVVRKPSLS